MIEKYSSLDEGDSEQSDWSDLGEEVPFRGELMSSEEKEKALTFEKMSELSSEEYLELWRHLNPFYVTHVTRQGIRDHVGMMYHSAGAGDFSDGAKDVLGDGKMLRSPAEINYGLPPNFTEDDVRKVLDELVFSDDKYQGYSPKQILAMLPFSVTLASADPWADKQAIHFAQMTVLDDYYGGETNNEVFYVFPTDVIASQGKFGGHMHDNLTTAQVFDERKWNDMFVWTEDGRIPLDAGFVFLPDSQMVDRNTGSKYATKEIVDETGETKLVVEKDEERISRFKEWIGNLSEDSPEIESAWDGDYSKITEILGDIGIPEECIDNMIFGGGIGVLTQCARLGHFNNLYGLSKEKREQMSEEEILDYSVREYLAREMADLKLAEDVISARDYWEQYFIDHPEQKPAHIVYYDGEPSFAVKQFLSDNGILEDQGDDFFGEPIRANDMKTITGPGDTSERDGGMLGFDQHYIGDGSEDEALVGEHKRFNEMALRILEEHYGEKE